MEELKKEIERLISEKKLIQEKYKRKNNLLLSIDEIIASKEKSAKIAKEKRNIANRNIANKDILKKDDPLTKPSKILKKSESYITKKKLIDQLRAAKVAHKRQMAFIQILVNTGNFHDVKATYPINYTTCDFGKWLYSEGLMLASLKEYETIELVHQKIHDYYLKIYNLYKTKITGTLLNSKKKQLVERDKKCNLLWAILKKQSTDFFDYILALEITIKNFSEQEIDALNVV
ncbi:MAG: CZB domain-containing protein [Flavobacteriaceae bacterium]|nr:CZB domain-containing protein [Flavobacteriaceae bacterium]